MSKGSPLHNGAQPLWPIPIRPHKGLKKLSHPAQILTRMTVLTADAHLSRLIIMHELYHLLGFHHPGSLEGVAMSVTLHAGHFNQHGERVPTRAEAIDLARLACIYVR